MFFSRRNGQIHEEELQLKKANSVIKREMKEKLVSHGNRISFNHYLNALKLSKGMYNK